MRHWNIEPLALCRQHLLGAHVETHMLAGSLRRATEGSRLHARSIAGLTCAGYIDPSRNVAIHEQLAAEMVRRGMSHRSPVLPLAGQQGKLLGEERTIEDLIQRCPMCAERIRETVAPSRGPGVDGGG